MSAEADVGFVFYSLQRWWSVLLVGWQARKVSLKSCTSVSEQERVVVQWLEALKLSTSTRDELLGPREALELLRAFS